MTPSPSTGYFVSAENPLVTVLVLPSAWGLTRSVKDFANTLADQGFAALALDLNAGKVAQSPQEAESLLLDLDINVAASAVLSAASLCSERIEDAAKLGQGSIAVCGFGAGASWALWLAARRGETVKATACYYGSQKIDFTGAQGHFLLQYGSADTVIDDNSAIELGLDLKLAGCELKVQVHQQAKHDFCEAASPTFAPDAAAKAHENTFAFVRDAIELAK